MRVILKVVKGPHLGAEFIFEEHASFVVGRNRKAQFRLPLKDKYLSRLHFFIEVKPPDCVVVDLRSTNNTYVNGEPVSRAAIKDGDTIRAGHTTLAVAVEKGGLAATPAPAFEPGTAPQIPHYRFERILGEGTTGSVFLAVDERDGSRVAVKVFNAAIANDPKSVAHVEREADILRQLNDPHIISLYELGRAGRMLYLIMEYVPGSDALNLTQASGGRLPVGRAVDLVCQTLDALVHAHAAGIVHRDVKPNNVLVIRGGSRDVVKLGDFGLARIYHNSSLSGLTVDGDVRGTLGFLAPEHVRDLRGVGPEADQYGAAATLYYLLTGSYTYDFPDDDVPECLRIVLQEDARSILEVCPQLPTGLAAVIHKALAREPSERFEDAKAMRQALSPWAARRPGHMTQ